VFCYGTTFVLTASKHLSINKQVMKKLSIMLVSALFAYQASAVAQSVKQTGNKNSKQTTTRKTVTVTAPPNTQEYSTSHKGPIESYRSIDSTQQGASALNRVEGDTTNAAAKATADSNKKVMPAGTRKTGSHTKVKP
jgi:hypothetical protein